MTKDKKLLIEELKKAWYDAKEIEKIVQWIDDIDRKKFFTPEEVYKHLLAI